jgi:hypothetical protein
MDTTVFVLVTDELYLYKTKKTIIDLRSTGQWHGDLVLINLGIPKINPNFLDFYNITEKLFPQIEEKNELIKNLHYSAFLDTIDGREISKPNQWEKLHVMDSYFKKWDRVVFLDAGLRVLDSVHRSILKLDYKGKFLAPDDGGNYIMLPNPDKLFNTQISNSTPKLIEKIKEDFPNVKELKEAYFLNCIWVYDTKILNTCSKEEMIDGILKYPVCKTNEMALMNLYIHFKYELWERFPKNAENGKILFDWCESNNPRPSTWRDYSFIKYPISLSLEDT